ncbi:hydroxypyruvate isomerase family protein [Arenibaculum pallidiluteum]|uniref:hydroxypyruvate isomerase family protein n=1 Tax=Arenibaculum pallidiluteum TaxID=2812559 RepID=UPI001A972CE6|nr:TIM barrel protein [Arenibaculum pallidiluteum]
MRIAANLSMLFTERPLAGRFAAAAAAGFDAVEIQFPYDQPVDALRAAAEDAGLPLVLINLPAGDLAAGEVGLASLPSREAEFRAAVDLCLSYARPLGVRKVNVLAGRPPDMGDARVMRTLAANLRAAGDRFGEAGIAVQVEAVNPIDVPGFLLTGLDHALQAIAAADHPNLHLQFDLYHMALTEPSLETAVRRAGPRIGHVQFADAPGRHEPGTGGLDFAAALRALGAARYDDVVSAEYRPVGRTEDGLGWLPEFRRLLAEIG